ncbi:MAG TPA: metal-dependent hydrolase [Sandaracinaceae bacterium]
MNAPGHLATAYLLARRGGSPRFALRFASLALGALLPDLADKPAMWAGATPYGRTVGHSMLVWGALLLLWAAFVAWRGTEASRGLGLVVLGGFSHLLVDFADDVAEGLERSGYVFSAWFGWPLTNPDMWNVTSPHLLPRVPFTVTTLEMATVAACLWHVLGHRGYGPRLPR